MLLKLLFVLPIAILVNITLGYVIASVKIEVDKGKLLNGFFKGGAVYLGIGGLYTISLILPSIEVNGLGTIDIVNSLILILSAVLGFYTYQSLQKLATIFKLKYQIMNQDPVISDFADTEVNDLEKE